MKIKCIFLLLLFVLGLAKVKVFAQTGTITNVQVEQRVNGYVDVYFDLSGTEGEFNISLEASFDAGSTYTNVPAGFLSGDVSNITPGNSKHVVWDGPGSFANTFSTQTKLKIIATENVSSCPLSVTDIDGNTYTTTLIGDQCWMAENLNTTKDAAGNNITRCCFDNATANCDLYGGLYDWATLMNGAASSNTNPSDVRGICPDGWHVPSDAEWIELTDFLFNEHGIENTNTINGAGNALKSCRQVNSPLGGDCNTSAHPRWNANGNHFGTDIFGLSAIPGGFRRDNGIFYFTGLYCNLWSCTEYSATNSKSRFLDYSYGDFGSGNSNKDFGYSVRCLKNESTSNVPTVETGAVLNITTNSADLQGEISDLGGSEIIQHGHCWAETQNPTIDDFKTELGITTELGFFTSNLAGLKPATTYYVKAYATNVSGIAYGDELSFVTTGQGITGQPCPGTPTVTDIDGNIYNTVLIGDQCWMEENLNTTHYSDGTPIPLVTSNAEWNSLGWTTKAYCYYNNSPANSTIYGALYSWGALMNGSPSTNSVPSGVQGVCPTGWHVPSSEEWEILEGEVDSQYDYPDPIWNNTNIWRGYDAGNNLKASLGWNNNGNGTDLYSFSALPGGFRAYNGDFYYLGDSGLWWSTTSNTLSTVWYRGLDYNRATVGLFSSFKYSGISVRCIKD